MTRSEQIKQAAENTFLIEEETMSLDEQSDMILRQVGFKFGAKWADKTMIDKACEWLKLHAIKYLDKCNDPTYMGGYFIDTENLLHNFRKAMEE